MQVMRLFIALGAMICVSTAAAACPPQPDRSDERAALHTQLLNATDEASAALPAENLWRIWLTAPDAKSQELLNRGMERRGAWDLEASEKVLDDLIAYCPDYTEGYNQRAFTRFLRQRYDKSLVDIEKVLAQDPYHFGALSGKALNLMRQGRTRLAHMVLREALSIHPFLKERSMLPEGGEDPI